MSPETEQRGARRRLFFALVPPPGARRELARLQRQLDCEGRVVKAENLHVTLAFLGMQESATLPAITAVAAGLAFPPCGLLLDRLGQFGRGRVLWLGCSVVPEPLQHFQQELVQALTAAGIGYDPKPWKLHLTLYRRLRKPPPTVDPVAIEWPAQRFDLVESVGARNGVEYHSLAHWKARS